MKYKCTLCFFIYNKEDLIGGDTCPRCHTDKYLKQMCPKDKVCECNEDVQQGIQLCPDCGEPICKCGSHDVFALSRVTGYYQDTAGWNKAKKEELKNRQRYDPIS